MTAVWAAAPLVALVLLFAFFLPSSHAQQAAYQYVQSAVDGEPAIFLNLWGTLGGCGAGTSNELLVQLMSGTILGQHALYEPQSVAGADPPLDYVAPDECVSLTGRALDDGGLGLLTPIGYYDERALPPYWQLLNGAASATATDKYTLAVYELDHLLRFLSLSQLLSLQPPTLLPLTGPAAGPSVGLLLNGGFEQTLSAASINATQDMAAGWTGNYTVVRYGSTAAVAPGLAGQPAASQRQYVSLLAGGQGSCDEAALLVYNCTASSLSQRSLPLVQGLQYSLSWYASCSTSDGSDSDCSFAVTAIFDSQLSTAVFAANSGTWQQQSLLFDTGSSYFATALLAFTQLTGGPLLDSIVLTYASTNAQLDFDVPSLSLSEEWQYAFANYSLFTATDDVPFASLVTYNTAAANFSNYTIELPGGLQSGVLVHTYPNHSYVAYVSAGFAQGNRSYTFSIVATALQAGADAIISLSLFVEFLPPDTGANTIPSYQSGKSLCLTTPSVSCQQAVTPSGEKPTRRRLLQSTEATGTVYYSCGPDGSDCYDSLLTVSTTAPGSLLDAGQSLVLQVVVFDMDVVLTSPQLTSDGPLFSLAIEQSSGDGGSGAIGDPQLTGLLGQSFQVHGVSGSVYNLVSCASLQVNARFDFLAAATVPAVPAGPAGGSDPQQHDTPSTQPWTHPGTYVGAMSFQVRRRVSSSAASSSRPLNSSHYAVDVVVVEAGEAGHGLARVSINGQQVAWPHVWQAEREAGYEGAEGAESADGADGAEGALGSDSDSDSRAAASAAGGSPLTVRFGGAGWVEVVSEQFVFRVTNSDRFLNHRMAPRVPLHRLHCHGLLGQTSTRHTYATALKHVDGSVDDYVVTAAGQAAELEEAGEVGRAGKADSDSGSDSGRGSGSGSDGSGSDGHSEAALLGSGFVFNRFGTHDDGSNNGNDGSS